MNTYKTTTLPNGSVIVEIEGIESIEPTITPQPSNQELKDDMMVIMNGLTDIYMATLGL